MGFLPFPASFIETFRVHLFQYSRRLQLFQVRDCGVFLTFLQLSIAWACFFVFFFLFLSSWALCCVLGSGIHKRASKTELAILHVYEENSIRAVLRAVDVIRIENQMRCSVPVTVLKILLAL